MIEGNVKEKGPLGGPCSEVSKKKGCGFSAGCVEGLCSLPLRGRRSSWAEGCGSGSAAVFSLLPKEGGVAAGDGG